MLLPLVIFIAVGYVCLLVMANKDYKLRLKNGEVFEEDPWDVW